MANLTIKTTEDGTVFTAKIVPGSSGQTRICGLLDGMLKVKVSVAPEKGKANKNLLDFLAKELGIKKNSISIISGQTGPVKQLQVSGISSDMLMRKLNLE